MSENTRTETIDYTNIIEDDIKIKDKSLMMIFLLEECNFSCSHCLREDEPMFPGYKLSFNQLKRCFSDCRQLHSIEWIHFSGGEPTLWTDGKRDLIDLLIEISKAGYTPGFTSNGSSFNKYNECFNFLQKYIDDANKPLRIYLSIDTFHQNFDLKRGRSISLDNIIEYKNNLRSEKNELIDISLIVTISKDTSSLLPSEMVEHYDAQGIKFNFVPLKLAGKTKSCRHLCPILKSGKQEDMGAYYRYYRKQDQDNTISNLILIGNDYYLFKSDYNLDYAQCWNKVGHLGHLPQRIIDAYSE